MRPGAVTRAALLAITLARFVRGRFAPSGAVEGEGGELHQERVPGVPLVPPQGRELLDLVLNHSSSRHAWFQASRATRDVYDRVAAAVDGVRTARVEGAAERERGQIGRLTALVRRRPMGPLRATSPGA